MIGEKPNSHLFACIISGTILESNIDLYFILTLNVLYIKKVSPLKRLNSYQNAGKYCNFKKSSSAGVSQHKSRDMNIIWWTIAIKQYKKLPLNNSQQIRQSNGVMLNLVSWNTHVLSIDFLKVRNNKSGSWKTSIGYCFRWDKMWKRNGKYM